MTAAPGRAVKARTRGERCVIALEFERLAEPIERTRTLLAAGARRAA